MPDTNSLLRSSRNGAYSTWDNVLGVLRYRGPFRTRGTNVLPTRYELHHIGGARGKPALNADIQNAAEATRMIADPDFEIKGTNCVSTCSAYNAEGGIKFTTTTGSADQVILAPHLDASQSPWTGVTWGIDKETVWECEFATGTAITSEIVWAGLKLTDTPVVATDNDQVFVRYEAGVASGVFQVIDSIGGTDVTTSTGITVAVSTRYHVKIVIAPDRTARVWIGVAGSAPTLVRTTAALTDATDLIPYVAIQTSTTAAKDITYYGQAIARNIG
jgi:hypothetical protein